MVHPNQLPEPYHLFASQRDVGVCCAVPQNRATPSFLSGETWAFSGIVSHAAQAPPDLNLRAAHASINLTGYHLFVALRTGCLFAPPEQKPDRIITAGEIVPYILILYAFTTAIALLA